MPPFDPPLIPDEVQNALGALLRVINPLATGGQAALFTVELQGEVAVLKIYKDALRVRAEREARALGQLQSNNIVKLLKWDSIVLRDVECIFTLTEFVEGEVLRERIDHAPMGEEEARGLGVDIATAICELWSQYRIVHRDINPTNIMIRADGTTVILDLGIARHTNLDTITEWGTWLGTPGYMSPEQARARKNLTFKSDLFSLGIVLYEATTQRHPFDRRQDLIERVDPPTLGRLTGVSEAFSRIVHSLLEPDPLNRPRSCENLIASLQRR